MCLHHLQDVIAETDFFALVLTSIQAHFLHYQKYSITLTCKIIMCLHLSKDLLAEINLNSFNLFYTSASCVNV